MIYYDVGGQLRRLVSLTPVTELKRTVLAESTAPLDV